MNTNEDYIPPRHPPRGPLQGSDRIQHSTSVRGIPAIRPRMVSSSPDIPSFTVEDVIAYIPTATEPRLVPVYGAELVVEKVVFVSAKVATELMQCELKISD